MNGGSVERSFGPCIRRSQALCSGPLVQPMFADAGMTAKATGARAGGPKVKGAHRHATL
jgi:hypothetical protein